MKLNIVVRVVLGKISSKCKGTIKKIAYRTEYRARARRQFHFVRLTSSLFDILEILVLSLLRLPQYESYR